MQAVGMEHITAGAQSVYGYDNEFINYVLHYLTYKLNELEEWELNWGLKMIKGGGRRFGESWACEYRSMQGSAY